MHKYVSGKLSSKGRLTIPSQLREKWGIQGGDRLSFELDDMENVKGVKPLKKKSAKDLFGIIKTDFKIDFELAREVYQKEAADKIMSVINEGK